MSHISQPTSELPLLERILNACLVFKSEILRYRKDNGMFYIGPWGFPEEDFPHFRRRARALNVKLKVEPKKKSARPFTMDD